MAGWADIAASYRWMHDKCEKKMAKSNMWITVPVIVLSTLTGSANFMLQSVIPPSDINSQKYAQIAIGSVSIFTGILTTLGNFFRYAQNSESNRVASIAWGKFQRQISIELALHPKERIDSMDFLKICRSDLDRLIEQSPPIPDDIIEEFEKEFEDIKNFKRPDIAHGIDHTKVFNSSDSRLKQLAVEATAMMRQKKKVWHDAMMPEVDKRVNKAVVDLSGSILGAMQDRVKRLEQVIAEQNEAQRREKERHASLISHATSFNRNNKPPGAAGAAAAPAPSIRGRDPTPRGIDPTPRGIDPTPRGIDPTPRGIDTTPRPTSDKGIALNNLTVDSTVPSAAASPSDLVRALSRPPGSTFPNPLMSSGVEVVVHREESPERNESTFKEK